MAEWRRSHPSQLCQDPEHLATITTFSYDLEAPGFRAYLGLRGLAHCLLAPGSAGARFVADHTLTREDHDLEPEFRFALEHDGERYEYTDREREIQWEILCSQRARTQDCWDVWTLSGRAR